MPVFTIRHVTTYRYRRPVAFGEHRMMLRPRDSGDQRLLHAGLEITPEPKSLRFVQDAFGNHLGIARFSGRSKELRFESTVCLEHSPPDGLCLEIEDSAKAFPFEYCADEMPDLARCIERHHADPEDEVGRWARQFLSSQGLTGTLELLTRLSQGIHRQFRYTRREEKGIQEPVVTLRLGQGSCRDFALLMIEAARALGFAARFASGYLATLLDHAGESTDSAGHGATHAWAQIYLPAAGWIDFDPTSGGVGKKNLVVVAVVRDPSDAIPLHGTFVGFPTDPVAMEVEVRIQCDTPQVAWAVPKRLGRVGVGSSELIDMSTRSTERARRVELPASALVFKRS
jgi:transglutaminase-like putative cysteine protease